MFMRCLFYSFVQVLLYLPPSTSSQHIPVIPINSFVVNSTVGSDIAIFSNFTHTDIGHRNVGEGGQDIYQFEIPGNKKRMDVQISTCIGSQFDTHLALFATSPSHNATFLPIGEGANDISCQENRSRAFISMQLTPGNYNVLITGQGEQEGIYNLSVSAVDRIMPPVPWGMDRIDQRKLPLDNLYAVKESGQGVWIYLIDSGVRASHQDFEGRVIEGYDFVNNEAGVAPDCTGHGTHVAGTIVGKHGISRRARMVAIRAFGCDNKATISNIIDSIGWVLLDSRSKGRSNIVIAMMFSILKINSLSLQSTMKNLAKSGIPVVVPSGNNGRDACMYYPGSLDSLLTIGSTNIRDERSTFSNFGNCVDVYAPGDDIPSTWHNSDTSYRNVSGSAQAAAHMVGIVSNFISLNRDIDPQLISPIVSSMSTRGVVSNVAKNETAKLGFVRSVPKPDGSPPSHGNVFLFIILGISKFDCKKDSVKWQKLQKTFSEISSAQKSRTIPSCVNQEEGTEKRNEVEHVQLRFQINERYAAVTFALLDKAINSMKEKTEEKLGFTFTVIEQPWAIDSRNIIFWGSPTFSETTSNSLGSGAIIGICVGVFCFLSLVSACLWIGYRRIRKLDDIESMEGSADREGGPIYFDDHGDDNDSAMKRSFRNVLRDMGILSTSASPNVSPANRRMITRMGSFIGGRENKVGRDMVRMESFGAEAFAGLASLSRANSTIGMEQSTNSNTNGGLLSGDSRKLSFRSTDNAVLASKNDKQQDQDFDSSEIEMDGSILMRSIDGETLALIQQNVQTTEDPTA